MRALLIVIASLVTGPAFAQGWLGLDVDDLTAAQIKSQVLPFGVTVRSISSTSITQKVDIRPGDIIVSFGKLPIVDKSGFEAILKVAQPGTEVSIVRYRGSEPKTVAVFIAAIPSDLQARAKAEQCEKIKECQRRAYTDGYLPIISPISAMLCGSCQK